jgi:EAL and modified HD-GYP domain-containing signal transduction protein
MIQVFVARQPIFDRRQAVYAYELLFRSGLDNYFDYADANEASSRVITNSFIGIGLEELTGGKRGFINFTSDLLVKEYATLFPKELLVVELLENIEPDVDIIAACQKLKRMGYILALDDFVYDKRFEPLIELADIIKVDFTLTEEKERRTLVERFAGSGVKLLAEKVETKDEFNQAADMGYSYFQGYFFSKPVIVSSRDIPASKLTHLRILREIDHTELDWKRIETIIKQEMSLSYKLLKYINSAQFGLRRRVESIRQALALLGERNLRKWIALVALTGVGTDKPMELVVSSIIRARFCESISSKAGLADHAEDLFLLGLFSMIDVLTDRPMDLILNEFPISDEVKEALLGESNRLRHVYESVCAYEQGSWEAFSTLASKLKIDESEFPPLYEKSVEWANQIFDVV